jgi:hypothetical protein
MPHDAHLTVSRLQNIRALILLFMAGLLLSGLTAFPIESQLNIAHNFIQQQQWNNSFTSWLEKGVCRRARNQCAISFYFIWYRLACFRSFGYCRCVHWPTSRPGTQYLGDSIWHHRVYCNISVGINCRRGKKYSHVLENDRLLLWGCRGSIVMALL